MYQINGAGSRSCRFRVNFLLALLVVFTSCGSNAVEERALPGEMDDRVKVSIEALMATIKTDKRLADSLSLPFVAALQFFYKENKFQPVWSSREAWKPFVDSFTNYLSSCKRDGLFPEDYKYSEIASLLKQINADSLLRLQPATWAKADLKLTNAFFHVLQDLGQGRLQQDSSEWKGKAGRQSDFFTANLNKLQGGAGLSSILNNVQPDYKFYDALKQGLPSFVDSMDNTYYTYVSYPGKDSIAVLKKLLKRLSESGFSIPDKQPDSTMLANLLLTYQKKRGLKQTGKLSQGLVNVLNNTDQERFKRIAITLDKYKQMPPVLPARYIWVNLPSYKLQVWDSDSLAMESKVIIGRSTTPTPVINSEISDIIVFPTWTVPNSIIVKEILPGLKKNPGYLARKGLGLFSNKGDAINPYTVNWSKYNKGIPYLVRQGSGDNNALGVIKFNFKNPYAVYLHDTNQRYLFKNNDRSLSHGCVRVQDWEKLAAHIMRNDSLQSTKIDSTAATYDSIITWINRKERHVIAIKNKLPVFIRYFSCEGINRSIKFYDDIYGEDKRLREQYFSQNR